MKTTIRHYLLVSCLMGMTASYADDDGELYRGHKRSDCTPCEEKILDELCKINKSLKKTNDSQASCCTQLENGLSTIETTFNTCCTNLTSDISELNNNLTTCCETLESELGAIANPCQQVTVIRQADIPLEITKSGIYCLHEDIFVDGSMIAAGPLGAMGISINATDVDLDLNKHTASLKPGTANPEGTILIAVLGGSTRVRIHNGIISGGGNPSDGATSGIAIFTSNVTVSDVQAEDFNGEESLGISASGFALSSATAKDGAFSTLEGVTIERCNFINNFWGIVLTPFCTNVAIRNCSLDKSIDAAIAQPSNLAASVSNVLLENVSISNSTGNGISALFNQTNWILNTVQIADSGQSGMEFSDFQSLILKNCQVFNSGDFGVSVSSSINQNVKVHDCQIFNSGSGALSINNANNLLIKNSQFTNYIPSAGPLLNIQNTVNASVRGCLLSSLDGTSDGLFASNCSGVTIQNCEANIFCNTPFTNCPVGFNIHGGVNNATISHCTVSGNPSIGIAIVPGPGPDGTTVTNTGIFVDSCSMQNVVGTGIFLSEATECIVSNCIIVDGLGNGITFDPSTTRCVARGNSVISNKGIGINNEAPSVAMMAAQNKRAIDAPDQITCTSNTIYGTNFAACNGTNYVGVPPSLVSGLVSGVGVNQNLSVVVVV